ncbi:MAG: BtrH N-terminal domain-containing protein [Caulobacteraceae bacterium]
MNIREHFKTVPGESCLAGNIANILMYYGFFYAEEDIVILGDGLNIQYRRTQNGNVLLDAGNPSGLFLRKYGGGLIKRFTKINEESMNFLVQSIRQGNPVVCFTPYQFVADYIDDAMDRYFHSVVILDVYPEESAVFISDACRPGFNKTTYEGKVPLESLLSRDLLLLCEIDFPSIKRLSRNQIESEVLQKILSYVNQKSSSNDYQPHSIEHFAADIPMMYDQFEQNIQSFAIDLVFIMKNYGLLLNKTYIYTFLTKLFGELPLIQKYKELIQQWEIVCKLLTRGGIRKSKSDFVKARDNILRLEQDELFQLRKIMDENIK